MLLSHQDSKEHKVFMLFLMYVIVRNSLSRSRSGKQSFLITKAPGRKRRKLLLQNRYILRKPLCILCVPRASVVQNKLTAESAKYAEEMQRKKNLCVYFVFPVPPWFKKFNRRERQERRGNATQRKPLCILCVPRVFVVQIPLKNTLRILSASSQLKNSLCLFAPYCLIV